METLTHIKRDIQAFADPRSEVITDDNQLYWEKDGQGRTATLIQSPGKNLPDIQVAGTTMSYRSFLASPHLADLPTLAEFISKTLDPPDNYVATRASAPDPIRTTNADYLVADLATNDLPFGSTRIILVQGEAGSGKTMALKKMTIDRACEYRDNAVPSLFFYIDVQGRALSRLDDAMARYLQDLRSRFSYHAVPPLVRNALLVPVIDGFDELLGSGGYDEAFSSLAAFVSQLEGRGAVVASARSAFFDYNSFRANAERFSRDGQLSYEVANVTIEPWRDEEAETLVSLKSARPSVVARFRKVRELMAPAQRDLLRKPFYVSQIANLLIDGETIGSDEAILDTLVDRFIRREHGKLLNRHGTPLLSVEGHREFLVRLSEEMWWLETRYLDVDTVRTWAELVLEKLQVPEEDARQIKARVPTYAFLTTVDSDGSTVRFEHEVFYSYFLAERLKQLVDDDAPALRRFLNRSILDDTVVDHAVAAYSADVSACSQAAISVSSVLQRGLTYGIARQNAGRLVARFVKSCGGLTRGTRLQYLYFDQDEFGDATLPSPRFQYCHFNAVDFTKTVMSRPRFEECVLQLPKVAFGATRFQNASSSLAESVRGIVVAADGSNDRSGAAEATTYYSPEHIAAILVKLGMDPGEQPSLEPSFTSRQRKRTRLLERFLRKMERRFYVTDEDINRFAFAREPEWTVVRTLMEQHGLLREEAKQMSGRQKPLIRLTFPPDVIRKGEDITNRERPTVTQFWMELLG